MIGSRAGCDHLWMERACFTFTIRDDAAEEYSRRHDEIWPELVQVIRDAGFRNYTIFRRGAQVIVYAECHPDIATAFENAAGSQVSERWAASLDDLIVEMTDAQGNLMWATEVWHLD